MRFYLDFSPDEKLKFVVDEKQFAEKLLEEDRPKGNPDWIAFLENKIKHLNEQIKAQESAL